MIKIWLVFEKFLYNKWERISWKIKNRKFNEFELFYDLLAEFMPKKLLNSNSNFFVNFKKVNLRAHLLYSKNILKVLELLFCFNPEIFQNFFKKCVSFHPSFPQPSTLLLWFNHALNWHHATDTDINFHFKWKNHKKNSLLQTNYSSTESLESSLLIFILPHDLSNKLNLNET